VQGPFLYLGNGWTDCAQTWYAVSSRPYRWLAQLGWGCPHARAHVHVPFLYLRNGCTDYTQIWYAVRSRSYRWLPQLGGGVITHVRTCTDPFYISGTAAPIALKLGMRLVAVPVGGFHISVGVPPRTCARARALSISQERPQRLRANLVCG
jgi:hypothetical protein